MTACAKAALHTKAKASSEYTRFIVMTFNIIITHEKLLTGFLLTEASGGLLNGAKVQVNL